jgi:PadR family transcriptional regulator, regulatory protein PadR
MPDEFRITVAVARVLREFLVDPTRPRYGYDLMQSTGYASGKLYPVLARLLHAGWLVRTAEEIDPSQEGRPARYMYLLSEQGVAAARQELAALQLQLSLPGRALRVQAEGGAA